ncbi:MAG: hypothetical protein QMC24_12865 [Akkermansiaceae bacterium]
MLFFRRHRLHLPRQLRHPSGPPDARILLVDSQFGIDEAYGRGLPVIGVYRDNR